MADITVEIESLLGIAPLPKQLPKRSLPRKITPAVATQQIAEVKLAEPAEEITPLVKLFQERAIRVRGTIEQLRICGADVGAHIGDKHYNRIIANYADKYLERISSVGTNGRPCKMLYLTEAGLYKYLLQSKGEEAEEFQDFVFDLLTAERKRTVDSIQLALKISQTEIEETRREKASMGRRETALYAAVNNAREANTKLKKVNSALLSQKHTAADAEVA
jgi:prophage antirepressor-like protein